MADYGDGVDNGPDNKWSKNGFGEPVTRPGGKFSKEETETVRRAVEDYCSTKKITTARLCSECDHKSELKGAWMEIAKALPHRTVQSVYRHGLRQLHPFKRGPWTEDECQQLVNYVSRMGKKWSAIQGKLHRSADSCRDKHREMSSDYVKGRWKEGETEKLKRLIREHLRADPAADIKDLGKMVEAEGIAIPWSAISKRMGKRSRLSCFKKWQKMTGLFSPSDVHKMPLPPPGPVPGGDVVHLATATAPTMDLKPAPGTEVSPDTALTAGAAAARAAQQQQQQVAGVPTPSSIDVDLMFLSELVSSRASRESDLDWNNFRGIDHALGRWKDLVDEWRTEEDPDDSVLGLPMWQVANRLLERKQQAKMAAETVDTVFSTGGGSSSSHV
mmetsp:Transcript_47084/g.70018  ORF Transcript_47084/g.70018 Transcript_47084/m.70018 type:complete len:387 (-) Transcript_47084:268-1428(-)|eukprot:CAMPEP_0194035510 /NCGR_PEP_ID=MMETSP0009_2-20130614/7929_1 /TAXON_ID=210454 /ORGANISM="Grammatophora oceanica, Strain CCMP 410" /LENGTH=386 /DNA_ID=CAMNT_0038676893 /DNA_START=129 /DNA_END=1289 /DNA_ORIENTATION=-